MPSSNCSVYAAEIADFVLQTKHLESHLFQEENFFLQKFLCKPIRAWKRVSAIFFRILQ
mgnify:CR=1 FL=1